MARSCINRIKTALSNRTDRPRRPCSRNARFRDVEVLESRDLMATFMVTSLSDAGVGSLRSAIVNANQTPGR